MALLSVSTSLLSAILPEDRADVMVHRYDGGGVTVDGPSILVRKSIGQSVSVSANYYVDSISCASIDVVTTASPYTEERTETSLSMDYLNNKTLMSLSYTKSDESDYLAETSSFTISHDMFGDLTTVSLGYSVGNDDISDNTNETFDEAAKRQNYRVGLTQILTKNSLLGLDFETITDEGFLHSPYRYYRFIEAGTQDIRKEIYPETRTSNALTFRLKYFLPYRAALSGEIGYFDDTWGIKANHVEIGYTHPLESNWIFDIHYRYYTQEAADFYSDLFSREGEQTYLARDKELSTFQDHTIGVGISYEFKPDKWQFIDHGSLNVTLDYIRFNYDDFRDWEAGQDSGTPWGEEPLYSFDAHVIKVFLSLWY
jgi:opacity protein-like surface antigen